MIPDACPLPQDFLAHAEVLAAPVRPAHCARVTQTPPEFTWPDVAPAGGQAPAGAQSLRLTFPDGHSETRTTRYNWLAWDRELPPGEYRWQVTGPGGERSAERRFTIERGAVAFVLPRDEDGLRRAKATARPRAPVKRRPGFEQLLRAVDDKLGVGVEPEPRSTSAGTNYDATVGEQKRTLAAALAWRVTGQRRYGEEAARRLAAQARWSTAGPLGFAENDMGSRTVAWTLALGYDWAYEALDDEQKGAIRAAIRARTEAMYRHAIADGELWRHPYSSHGNVTLTLTAAIAALMAGDLPEADEWFRGSVRAAAVWTSPWGAGDGGFANGTMQAQWDTYSNLVAWHVLEHAAGVPIFRKQWVREHGRFLAYFVPEGAPGNLFGDGQELRSEARQDEARIENLVVPPEKWAARRLGGGEPAAVFPSIGWVAMHSDLADPGRTSVYFKSSPYGSYNHAHADQNAFVIDSAGERLAIASGYYDGYKTSHWREWYKQTRAANAITFDGGQGQGIDGMQFAGRITAFDSDGRRDRATGDAVAAYAGALTRAERTVTYDRASNTVTVRDLLASQTPRTWEWNLHSLERMEPVSGGRVSVRKGRAHMCVEMRKSPAVEFTQTDEWTAPPSGKAGKQWHGRFATRQKTREAEFVAVMKIGKEC
jgi:hypothetical protein